MKTRDETIRDLAARCEAQCGVLSDKMDSIISGQMDDDGRPDEEALCGITRDRDGRSMLAFAEMGGVRVRELAWVKGTYTTTDDDGGPMEGIVKKLNAWRAGQYTIIRQHGKDGLYIVRGLRQGVTTVFPTLEAAKDACDREGRSMLAFAEPGTTGQRTVVYVDAILALAKLLNGEVQVQDE